MTFGLKIISSSSGRADDVSPDVSVDDETRVTVVAVEVAFNVGDDGTTNALAIDENANSCNNSVSTIVTVFVCRVVMLKPHTEESFDGFFS